MVNQKASSNGWFPNFESLIGKTNGKLDDSPSKKEAPKAPIIKKRTFGRLSAPKIEVTVADEKAALDLIFEELEVEQLAEQQQKLAEERTKKEQRQAEEQEKRTQMESILGFVEWMIAGLKFINDVNNKLSRLDPVRQERFLAKEIPGHEGLTVKGQVENYQAEIEFAKRGDDLTIELYLTVVEEVFWLSTKNFSVDEFSEKMEDLIEKNVIQEDKKGVIEDLGKKKYSLAKRFDGLDQDVKASLKTQLCTAIANQVTKLKQKIKVESTGKATELMAQQNQNIPLEELLFGNPDQFREGKSSVIAWKYLRHDNIIKVTRYADNHLYIDAVVGQRLSQDFDKMKAEMPKEMKGDASIPIEWILDQDRKRLCPIVQEENQRPIFNYGGNNCWVEKYAFSMTFWIRLGAGNCLPQPRVPEAIITSTKTTKNRKRPIKPIGELLTDQEFIYQKGLGEYDLVYEPGFYYEPRDQKGKTGQRFTITIRAIARLERIEIEDKSKIVLKNASTNELICLLVAGGAIVNQDDPPAFFEGVKGSSLPEPIRLGISQMFGRLKEKENKGS